MKKAILFLLIICCYACKSKTANTIQISLADSGHTLKFNGLDPSIIGEISRDTAVNIWQSLIPVYKMPADTDMKDFQTAQPGKYLVSGSTVLFTPDTPFAKQQTYFIRYYRYADGNSLLDYLKKQKKLSVPQYTDLPFKQ